MKFLWLGIHLITSICNAKQDKLAPRDHIYAMNIKVKPLSPHTLQVTWDPPLFSETLVGYSLVFFQVHDKTRTHVEIFMNHYILTNLRPGTRYKIKLAPLRINNGKPKGFYSNWVNARTPPANKTTSGLSPDSKVETPNSSLVPGNCSRVSKLCENIGYNFTQMPNYFNQQKHNDAATHEFSQFTHMIQSSCSSVLQVFLCSLYFPPCADGVDSATPPCRSVCRAARRGCEPWLKRSGFKWPYKFKCSGFPEPSDRACVGEDGTITHEVPEQCELMNVNMCHGLDYNFVRMPNFFGHPSQKEAGEYIKVFYPLVVTNCSPVLRFFLCVLYVPLCVVNMNMEWEMVRPCRDVCEEARRGCEPVLSALGFRWPEKMKCEKFPEFDKKGSHSSFCLRPKTKPPPRPEITQPQSRCLPLKIPMCRNLSYTHTILPNFLNHTSQSQVNQIMNSKAFQSHLKSKCSQHLRRFVCFLFAPYCTSDGTALPPCRSFCEKVKTDCANISAHWLADLNCTRFPTLSRKRLCFGDPLTTMDCIGPHSRPCTVISSTFPIILKCSSPSINFSINEITINLYNGTNVLVTSKSDALRQCNQSRRQAEGRHECQFIVKYGEFGIDTLSVSSVAVKYHCLRN